MMYQELAAELVTLITELDAFELDDKELLDDAFELDEELGGVCPDVHSIALRIISTIFGSAKLLSTWPTAV